MGRWEVLRAATRFAAAMFVVGSIAGASGGCATPAEPLSQVQSNATRKAIFVRKDAAGAYRDDSDSWYFRATITDVPSTSAVDFIGSTGDMYRIKWRIEETFLLAYREDPDILNSGDKSGGVIAAFPILSHFDVRRDYNANSGEELNILVENATDRPWYERDYMRVDWATNKISEKMWTMPALERMSAATYFVQDPTSADHPIFENDYVVVAARDPATLWRPVAMERVLREFLAVVEEDEYACFWG